MEQCDGKTGSLTLNWYNCIDLGMVVHACAPSFGELDTGEAGVWSLPCLHNEFEYQPWLHEILSQLKLHFLTTTKDNYLTSSVFIIIAVLRFPYPTHFLI